MKIDVFVRDGVLVPKQPLQLNAKECSVEIADSFVTASRVSKDPESPEMTTEPDASNPLGPPLAKVRQILKLPPGSFDDGQQPSPKEREREAAFELRRQLRIADGRPD